MKTCFSFFLKIVVLLYLQITSSQIPQPRSLSLVRRSDSIFAFITELLLLKQVGSYWYNHG